MLTELDYSPESSIPAYFCPSCGRQYFYEQDCPYCPGVSTVQIPVKEAA
jgi:uncharacterized OB-fold protein